MVSSYLQSLIPALVSSNSSRVSVNLKKIIVQKSTTLITVPKFSVPLNSKIAHEETGLMGNRFGWGTSIPYVGRRSLCFKADGRFKAWYWTKWSFRTWFLEADVKKKVPEQMLQEKLSTTQRSLYIWWNWYILLFLEIPHRCS